MDDLAAYERVMADICDDTESAFSVQTAMQADNKSLPTFRISVKYMCPDRVPEIDDALDSFARTQRVCDIPASVRTHKEDQAARAMSCP